MIGLLVDSSSQIPAGLKERYDIEVVAIPVIINGAEFLEGETLDTDEFYQFFDDTVPSVSTSQPSPGQVLAAYQRLIDRGCDQILSVHVAASMSGTLNSARLAAERTAVPVRLVDSGTASFGISCCVWDAAEAIRNGADLETAAVVAEATADRLQSVFILQALDFVMKGGRITGECLRLTGKIPVLGSRGDVFRQLGTGTDVGDLCDQMADAMHADGAPIRAAVGIADAAGQPFADGLTERLAARDDVVDLVHYRVGPSVGALTGPGTAGGFWYPIKDSF